MKIQNTRDIAPDTLTVLIYGQSGVGKTTLASTLESSTLIINAESGMLTLKGKDIDYVTLEGMNGIDKMNSFRSIMGEISKSDYQNIYIDSLTEISQCLYEEATSKYPNDRNIMQRYGHVKETTKKILKYFRDMKKNVFMTALEVAKDMEGSRYVWPNLIGSSSHEAPGYCDFVFNLQVFNKDDKKIRAILTDAKNGVIAKSRVQSLNEYEPANLQNIINKINGGV